MVEYRDAVGQVFHALSHPVRREILTRIARREQTVTQLAAPFATSLESVSQHIRVLEQAGLLTRSRRGREHRCRLNPAPLRDAAATLARLARIWESQLDSLERFLRDTDSHE